MNIIRAADIKNRDTTPNPANKCVVLVPYSNRIEHEVEESLRVLESRGYAVWRVWGYSAIDQARNRMCYDALYYNDFEEIMWIDADVGFNPDDVDKIRQYGLPICAGAYPFKGVTFADRANRQMTIQLLDEDKGSVIEFGDKGGLIEIKSAATGFLYTKKEVYEAIKINKNLPLCNTSFDAPQYPFFHPNIFEENGGNYYYLGEDFSFCRYAVEAGYRIILDTTVKLKHIGLYPYQWEDLHLRRPNCSEISYYDPTDEPNS
jgi:hypothetical protein